MHGKGLRLYKREKLCSVTAIDRLFAARPPRGDQVVDPNENVGMTLVYPLRMVYGRNTSRKGVPVQFLISVPKRRLRHAVDRALMRRRIREAYRHVRGPVENVSVSESRWDVAFIYVADTPVPYSRVLKAVEKLMSHLTEITPTSINRVES